MKLRKLVFKMCVLLMMAALKFLLVVDAVYIARDLLWASSIAPDVSRLISSPPSADR